MSGHDDQLGICMANAMGHAISLIELQQDVLGFVTAPTSATPPGPGLSTYIRNTIEAVRSSRDLINDGCLTGVVAKDIFSQGALDVEHDLENLVELEDFDERKALRLLLIIGDLKKVVQKSIGAQT